ncbi:MAG: hypothetical protein MJE77_33115 [Proteobacteria bacterium]|nr:hypothetical protein [Pseudomonadota bacterium]
MKERIEARLGELRREFASGQQVMAELQRKQAELHETLARIGGAIQVLEELLAQEPGELADTGRSNDAAPSAVEA